jgi:hypothetical protein
VSKEADNLLKSSFAARTIAANKKIGGPIEGYANTWNCDNGQEASVIPMHLRY